MVCCCTIVFHLMFSTLEKFQFKGQEKVTLNLIKWVQRVLYWHNPVFWIKKTDKKEWKLLIQKYLELVLTRLDLDNSLTSKHHFII